jgi:hypothetical protein
MLVFPSLGSQAEVSQNRPKDSEYPWNTTMYPETPATSIYFFAQVPKDGTLDTLSADNKRVRGPAEPEARPPGQPVLIVYSGVNNTACVAPPILTSALHRICPASLIAKAPVMK